MERTTWRDVLVFVAVILFLLCVAAPLAFGQACPPGGCPSPQSQGPIHQIFGGRSGGSWGVWSGGGQALPDRSRRQHPSSAPEFIVKLSGASGVLFYKNERVGVILTAQHVIRSAESLSVVFPDGERHTATVIQGKNGETATDSIWDVAFLEIPSPSARHCRVAEGPPSIGEAVRICGYGHDRIYAETTGTVKNFVGDPQRRTEGSETMVLSGEAKPGDSGGPIFNSKGELIGLVSASTWNSPMQADETISPALSRIYGMCQSRVYLWPWNARTEQERIRSESDVEQERIRSQAEVEQERLRSQGQQQPLPYPIQQPPSVDVNVEVGKKLEPLEKTVKEQGETLGKHQEKIDYFDQIVVSIKEKTAVLEKSGSEFDKMLAARVREVQADVLAELTPKVEEAAAAVDSKAGAVAETVAGKVAGKAAEEAVEKATPGLLDKLKGLLPTGLVEKIDGLKNLLATHTWILGGLVIVVILLVFKDIKDFVKSGGEDKLMIQKLAGMTPWQWDDRLADRVASRLEKRFEKPEAAVSPSA